MSEDKRGQGGEFRGDFTRDTFDPAKNFTRVLMQQGRVQLDADWNEQVSILHHYMRQLGEDLMGPHAAPADEKGEPGNNFNITVISSNLDFSIAHGNYYVQGISCRNNDTDLKFSTQPNYSLTEEDKQLIKNKDKADYLVYLDVWERHLTYLEDDDIREKALGGADTATRAQIMWQVKIVKDVDVDKNTPYDTFLDRLISAKKTQPGGGKLRARAKQASDEGKDPCLTAPEASYRGAENQLYRVEIHNSGDADKATFKWSRENGAVLFPIIDFSLVDNKDVKEVILELEHLGRDDRFGLEVNDWVEVVNKNVTLQNQDNPLLQVTQIDKEKNQVFLRSGAEQGEDLNGLLSMHPSYLRRWDQKNNAEGSRGGLTVSKQADNWISLENGIEIQFESKGKYYQTGDYWLIPARTATGDVEWPGDPENPDFLPPDGVEHYYAPLAKITVGDGGAIDSSKVLDLRRKLQTSLAQ